MESSKTFSAMLFALCFNFSTSITIECNFHDDGDWWVLKEFYYCNINSHLNIISQEMATIDAVNGSHVHGKSLDDVAGFEADNQTIHYFPKGLEKIFKNLKMIDINYGRLKEIHQSDFKPFPKLVCLELYENDIEVLEEGLFDYNPLLEMIWLSSNKIIHIDVNLFDKLTKITYLSLDANSCISELAEDNRTAVEEIISHAKIHCKDMSYLKRTYPVFMAKFNKMQVDLDNVMEKMQSHSDDHVFWSILILMMIFVAAICTLGFYVYKTRFHKSADGEFRVSFENQQYI